MRNAYAQNFRGDVGNGIWKPLAYQNGLTYESVKVRASPYFLLYIRGMLKGIAGDAHYFGYNFERLKDMLEETEFTNIERKDAQDLHTREAVCLRVECIRTKGN